LRRLLLEERKTPDPSAIACQAAIRNGPRQGAKTCIRQM